MKKISIILLVFGLLIISNPVFAGGEINTFTVRNCIDQINAGAIIDGENGEIFWLKNGNKQVSNFNEIFNKCACSANSRCEMVLEAKIDPSKNHTVVS